MDSLDKLLDFIKENNLFLAEDRILLAVSGGKDSVFMAHLFSRGKFNFGIAHCNFHLRGEDSERDETLVKNLAKDLGVPFFKVDFDTQRIAQQKRISIQMVARELRYEWFEKIRREHQYEAIALAQHQTDSMETMLLNLVRGTGISGLHGILPRRDHLIRPLLAFTAQEITDQVKKEKIVYREDVSNQDTKYARNKIRLGVLPALRSLNSGLEATFMANSQRFYALEKFLAMHITDLRKAIFQENADHSFHIPIVSLSPYFHDEFLLYELFKPFAFSEAVLSDLSSRIQEGTGKTFYSKTHKILINRRELTIKRIHQEALPAVIIQTLPKKIEWAGKTFNVYYSDDVTLPIRESIQKVDAEKVIFPIKIRSWKNGDSFKPLGLNGRKKISDFLIAQKVPLDEKKEVPIFVNANEDVLWVAPWRTDDRYKITAKTKKVIIFEQL